MLHVGLVLVPMLAFFLAFGLVRDSSPSSVPVSPPSADRGSESDEDSEESAEFWEFALAWSHFSEHWFPETVIKKGYNRYSYNV